MKFWGTLCFAANPSSLVRRPCSAPSPEERWDEFRGQDRPSQWASMDVPLIFCHQILESLIAQNIKKSRQNAPKHVFLSLNQLRNFQTDILEADHNWCPACMDHCLSTPEQTQKHFLINRVTDLVNIWYSKMGILDKYRWFFEVSGSSVKLCLPK